MSSLEYRALTRVEVGSALEFNTLLFAGYWRSRGFDTESPAPIRIFDLGRVQSSSIDFFSGYPCYLTLVDAIESLARIRDEDDLDEAGLKQHIETLIPLQSRPYDLILIWDSLNYLCSRVFPLVHQRLLQLCHRHSQVHGFLYTSQLQYDRPWRFHILTEDRMACQANPGCEVRTAPMNSLAMMNRMPGFRMQRSVLMRNGMQEFMLRRAE